MNYTIGISNHEERRSQSTLGSPFRPSAILPAHARLRRRLYYLANLVRRLKKAKYEATPYTRFNK